MCITFAWQVDKLGLLQLVRMPTPRTYGVFGACVHMVCSTRPIWHLADCELEHEITTVFAMVSVGAAPASAGLQFSIQIRKCCCGCL